MNYESAFYESYAKARDDKRSFLRHALEEECLKMMQTSCDYKIRDEDYENIILPYWRKYNTEPKRFWFEFYGSKNRALNPYFIPADLYFNDLIPYLNNMEFAWATADKCFLDRRFLSVKMPATVCKCISGLYYDRSQNPISEESAIKLCLAFQGKMIVKPSIYSHGSRNTFSIDPLTMDEKKMLAVFRKSGANFIVQDRVKQHKELALLNPDTVNTIRVLSILTNEGVYIPGAFLRVGAKGESVIEAGSGGYYCDISDDNRFADMAYHVDVIAHFDETGFESREHILIPVSDRMGGKYKETYRVPSMDKIRDKVRELHYMIPHLRFVGWDFTVNENGEPVLFEFNSAPGAPIAQLVTGKPVFGEKTDWVLDDFFIHRTLEKNHRQTYIYL